MSTNITTISAVVNDSAKGVVDIVKATHVSIAAVQTLVLEMRDATDKKIKSIQKKMKARNEQNDAKDEERDAKDAERDAKDAQRDAIIVALQGELRNVKKRAADVTSQDGHAPKMQRTWPTNITNNAGASKPWGFKKVIRKTSYVKNGFHTMAEAVTALENFMRAHP
jgi:hypothetical protein